MKFSPDNSLKHHSCLAGVEGWEFVGGFNRTTPQVRHDVSVINRYVKNIFSEVEQSVGGPKLRDDVTAFLERYGCKHYIKEDLRSVS